MNIMAYSNYFPFVALAVALVVGYFLFRPSDDSTPVPVSKPEDKVPPVTSKPEPETPKVPKEPVEVRPEVKKLVSDTLDNEAKQLRETAVKMHADSITHISVADHLETAAKVMRNADQ